MPAKVEDESEILLGNKQLLAVFAVVAILLAVAFTGGYMLGKSSAQKKATSADAQTPAAADSTALVPQTVTPDDQPVAKSETPARPPPVVRTENTIPPPVETKPEPVLGSRKVDHAEPDLAGVPRSGQTFVQVAALTRPQAEATAEVLRKQHFPARIAPKPGTSIFRVLIGPTNDAADITNTRDALRKIGFRDVIVQHY
jgi:cell division protein FtsN